MTGENQVQEVKDRVDIVDFVGQYVPLKRSGLNHKGLCPFHSEKSPSFMVNAERQSFKCFGCDEGGDVITFVQKMEGLTFPEALELLADRVGITLDRQKAPEQYKREKDVKSRLFRVNAASAKFFHHLLTKHPSGQTALDYLHGRTVTDETISKFQLGYAPTSSALAAWLGKQGYTATDLREAGSPERFRNRVVFPIRDTLGNVVGFTGRLLPVADPPSPPASASVGVEPEGPKYYNTPETPIFRKSRLVYGLAEAKQAIRQAKQAILMEGQMDVVLSHQAGVETAVASSGTAITLEHLQAIKRYTNTVLLAFDSDTAGVAATKKTLGLVFDAELAARVIPIPAEAKDAGEVIEQDPAAWVEATKAPLPAMDWLLESEVAAAGVALDGPAKKTVARVILPLVARVLDPVERAHYVGMLAHRLSVPEQSLLDALKRAKDTPHRPGTPSTQVTAPTTKPTRSLVMQLAGLLALHPSALASASVTEDLFTTDAAAANLYKAVKLWYSDPRRHGEADSFQWIKSQLSESEQTDLDALAIEVTEMLGEHSPASIALELSTRLRRDGHESVKASIAEQIQRAESNGDRAQVKKLMVQLQNELKT